MKIFIKNLRGDKTELEVEESDTVLTIKEKLETLQNHAKDLQKLILAGKILEDSKTVSESGVVEGSILVLMVSKAKAPAKPVQPEPPAPSVPVPAPISSAPPAAVDPPAPVSSEPASIEGPSALLTGDALSQTINSIVDMGFDRKDVEAAMKAAYNNPDRAIEYLTGGMPEARPPPSNPSPANPSNPSPANPANPAGANPPGNMSQEQFRQLLQDPTFMQLMAMIQSNPATLQPILSQLQQGNPELYNLIVNNQDQFMRLLEQQSAPRIDPSLVAGLPRPPPPRGTQIVLTLEEQQSIKNLIELGFSRDDVLEAFLSCDKNESLAANLLFENYQPVGSNPDFEIPGPDRDPPENP